MHLNYTTKPGVYYMTDLKYCIFIAPRTYIPKHRDAAKPVTQNTGNTDQLHLPVTFN